MNLRFPLILAVLVAPLTAPIARAAPAGSDGPRACGEATPVRYGYFVDQVGRPPAWHTIPSNPLSLRYRERFLAASGNTNRLTLPEAVAAHLVDGPRTFADIDCQHRGAITLEDVRRFVRDGGTLWATPPSRGM